MTDDLIAEEFPAFFRHAHGWSKEHGWALAEAGPEPFPWQTRLLREWVAGPKGWPPVLDLPTGSGKTAALDVAVFHLAMGAHKGEDRRAPVRIAFVVDRRLIVDDAYGRAKRFRGYGVSDSMKPVHAGLLGSYCLILLDEAHLSEPFRQTLRAVGRYHTGWRDPGWRPSTPSGSALLTATPDQPSDEPFGLQQEDRDHPVLRLRLEAAKPARLMPITGKNGSVNRRR